MQGCPSTLLSPQNQLSCASCADDGPMTKSSLFCHISPHFVSFCTLNNFTLFAFQEPLLFLSVCRNFFPMRWDCLGYTHLILFLEKPWCKSVIHFTIVCFSSQSDAELVSCVASCKLRKSSVHKNKTYPLAWPVSKSRILRKLHWINCDRSSYVRLYSSHWSRKN